MKIAHVVSLYESVPPQSKNGLEFVVSWLVDGLVERGHEVTLFAPATSKTNAHLVSIVPKGTGGEAVDGSDVDHFNYWNLANVGARSKEFDIIHFHTDGGSVAAMTDVPLVETLHHPYKNEFLEPYLKRPGYVETLAFVLEQYSKINYVAVSKNQEQHFMSAEAEYFKKHTTIYNGIPVEKFEFNNFPKDYLFYIGYINADKGADVAVQVARALNMKLILAGSNFGMETFFKEKIEPYLNDDIKYIGAVDFSQKIELYKNAVATLAPITWDEPFGLTLAESQACGTPVIAFNKGAAVEVIKHGETGYVVTTLEEMIESVKNIKSIDRQACRSWVEKNFSVDSMVEKYIEYYQALIKKQ